MAALGGDTRSLRGDQLSVDEVGAIIEIEKRLSEARLELEEPKERSKSDFSVPILERDPRVLLLDGERGTGKTSMLLTLMERWRGGTKTENAPGLGQPPSHVTVIGNLDFDPLPPGMPLIAGIVQAWKPLVEALQEVAPPCDDEGHRSLADRWHMLFHMAASWSDVPTSRGLIEQVLDREEQVQDWHKLSEKWREFVNFVAWEGAKQGEISQEPVFVIIVDDCDLQVARISELLPAIRNLYHERVFFLVAAESQHMMHMLQLDFAGQQAGLVSGGKGADIASLEKGSDRRWASDLAYSTFQKVFTRDNQWRLKLLSLREFLAYPERPGADPPGNETFFGALSALPCSEADEAAAHVEGGAASEVAENEPTSLSSFLWDFARKADAAHLPGVMTYRGADQLHKFITRIKSSEQEHKKQRSALHVLAALFSGRADSERAIIQDDQTIDVPIAGEIASLFRPKAIEFARYNVVFGTRPDFSYLGYGDDRPTRMSQSPHLVNWTALLAAKALEEKRFPVDAAGIRWDTYLSLAWTEWQRPPASFLWNRHRHPRPDQLLCQAEEWANCVRRLGYESYYSDRFAYAWVYYQIKWNSQAPDGSEIAPDLSPLLFANDQDLPWDKLLGISPTEDLDDWRNITLPLLARPEIGFTIEVQKKLIGFRDKSKDPTLRKLRRRYVTNAVVALAAHRGENVTDIPSDDKIEGFIIEIEEEFSEKNDGKFSPWRDDIDMNVGIRRL